MVRDLGGEAVLLDLASQRYFGLDEVGLAIWKCLEEGLSPHAVVDALLLEFAVERPRLEQDVEQFLGRLETAGLVELASVDGGVGA